MQTTEQSVKSYGIVVDPFTLQKGDWIADKWIETFGVIKVLKKHQIKKVWACSSGNGFKIHLDGECIDRRFAVIVKVAS